MFTENDAYAQDYTSKEQIDGGRLIAPKLGRSVGRRLLRRELTSVVDVGAGVVISSPAAREPASERLRSVGPRSRLRIARSVSTQARVFSAGRGSTAVML